MITRNILLVLVLIAWVGGASATDYYVSVTGNNSDPGNLTHPWQNVSYATQQAVAGDTIYLFNCTWYNEHAYFANSGNATHPITLTAYNGTPELDGVDKTGIGVFCNYKNYIRISGLTIHRYEHCAHISDSYNTISNCVLYDSGDVVIIVSTQDSTHNTIENCTLYDSGWNTIQMSANREPPDGNGIPATHITIRNCTIYNSSIHNAIDLFGNTRYVIIEDCELYNNTAGCIYKHSYNDWADYLTIRNNNFHDTGSGAIKDLRNSNHTLIENNTFQNIHGVAPILSYATLYNVTIRYNEVYDCSVPITLCGAHDVLFDRNYVHSDSATYRLHDGSDGTVRNPLGRKSVEVTSNSDVIVEFDDGALFTAGITWGTAASYTPPRFYPNKSNCSATSPVSSDCVLGTTLYNVSLHPTYAYLKEVTVNHESDASDDRTNIAVNSTETTNPTWINATMQNATHNYSVSVDGSIVDYVFADSDGVVMYNYTSSWSPHTFEFDWVDQGVFDPDRSKSYYNTSSPILNTVNSTGYTRYARTLGWGDTVVTSLNLVVETT